jgi:hypothetical protein
LHGQTLSQNACPRGDADESAAGAAWCRFRTTELRKSQPASGGVIEDADVQSAPLSAALHRPSVDRIKGL